MHRVKAWGRQWGPALVWMAAIFISSATPSADIPQFGLWDTLVKKGGHFLAYAVLALAYRRGLGWRGPTKARLAVAWGMAFLYALSDEFHQAFVPGRHPSLVDAFVFDGVGALTALVISTRADAQTSKRRGRQNEK